MPNAYLQKISDKHGITLKRAEDLWQKAKGIAEKNGHGGEYDYITGIFKKMLGESLTLQEMDMLSEYKWETSIMVPTAMKRLLNKILVNKNLKGAIQQYVDFTKKGMKHADAIHKASTMYGFDNDKMFADLITKLQKNGLLESNDLSDMFFRLLEADGAVSVGTFVKAFFEEDGGAPTNTSNAVAPDRDHKGKKDVVSRKKKKKKDKEESVMEKSFKSFSNIMNEGRMPKMGPAARRKASKDISQILKPTYFSSVAAPINEFDAKLEKLGYKLVNEDGTDLAAIYSGSDGRASIHIADSKGDMVDNYLSVQWHKMPSGKYEVNMYLS